MTAIGITIMSEGLARRCIWILPPKYNGLITALNTQNKNLPLYFEDFNAMLLEEEIRQNTRTREDSAFATGTKKVKGKDSSDPSSSDAKKRKKKIKCFYYNKAGHKQNKCRKKIVDEKNRVKKERKKVY